MQDTYTDEFNDDLNDSEPRCNETSYSADSTKTD